MNASPERGGAPQVSGPAARAQTQLAGVEGGGPSALAGPVAAIVVLALFYAVLLLAAREHSATFDEPGHATAGYAYWKSGDYRFDPENGNLPQRWFGLALLGGDFAFPPRTAPAWQAGDTWALADTWFNRMGNDVPRLLARGRAAAGLFAVALGFLVWAWGRRILGPGGGLGALLLYVTNPTVLAHGALMTSDIAATLGFGLFLWCFDALLRRCTPGRILAGGLALGALAVSKMSVVLAGPVALVLVLVRAGDGRALVMSGRCAVHGGGRKLLVLVAAALAQVALAVVVIWASFGFRFAAQPDGPAPSQFLPSWEWVTTGGPSTDAASRLPPEPPFAVRVVNFARQHELLPEAYLYGCAQVWKSAQERSGFLRGEVSTSGWRLFFPYAFAIKTPLAALALLALALAAGIGRRPRGPVPGAPAPPCIHQPDLSAALPLVVLLVVYGAAAMASGINLGLRHVLPVFPALFILSGAAVWWGSATGRPPAPRWLRVAPVVLPAILVAEAAGWFPHYLAYFNGLVAPARGYRHLVDSSLDWGQDLPALRRHLAREPAHAVAYLAYFGTASPRQHGIAARQIYSYPAGDRSESPPLRFLPGPQDDATVAAFLRTAPDYDPALVFAVSADGRPATMLVKRAAALRLAAGTYYVSASLLQPVHHPQAFGAWSARHEAVYRDLRDMTAPLLDDRRAERIAALNRHPPDTWLRALRDFEEYRFARLTAWLRRREPVAQINFSILVYRLSAADLDQALNGPPP